MGTEIERKFLVAGDLDVLVGHPSAAVEQGYLAHARAGAEVRLRRLDSACFLTVKGGSGLVRSEHEVAVDPAQFDALWPATEGARLSKRRYTVPLGNATASVDVYEDRLAGLVTAEVEFEDEAAAGAFQPPDWFGPEVTGQDAYANKNLATAPGAPTPARLPARHLGLVTVVVPDYDEALAFYVGTLAFELLEDTPLEPGKRWVVVRPRGGRESGLLLARATTDDQRAHVGRQTGGRVAFFLCTDDFAADYERMRNSGVLFEEQPRQESYGEVAVFQDPFGNRWDLLQLSRKADT